ncbi:hypothetical protein JHW43_001320 [Diplocarpon mali]|nr:hypothetical protein JHW43_001320 [Diplocarpon mali]
MRPEKKLAHSLAIISANFSRVPRFALRRWHRRGFRTSQSFARLQKTKATWELAHTTHTGESGGLHVKRRVERSHCIQPTPEKSIVEEHAASDLWFPSSRFGLIKNGTLTNLPLCNNVVPGQAKKSPLTWGPRDAFAGAMMWAPQPNERCWRDPSQAVAKYTTTCYLNPSLLAIGWFS